MTEEVNGQGGASEGGENNAPDWTSGLGEEHLQVVQAKGWDSPAAAIDSYRNAEKLIGADPNQILKLPNEFNNETLAPIYDKLGRPADPKDYDFSGVTEDNKDFIEAFAPLAHANGLTKQQAAEIARGIAEASGQAVEAQNTELSMKLDQEKQALAKEWGSKLEENTTLAKQAAQEFGVEADTIDALEKVMGFSKVMKLFNQIGAKISEHGYKGGEEGGNKFGSAMTPGEAQAKIKELEADPKFQEAWHDKGHPGHKDAMARRQQLFSYAFPEG